MPPNIPAQISMERG